MSLRPAIILNASSGSDDKRETRERIAEIFKSRGLDAHLLLAHSGAEIISLAEQVAREDYEPVVAGGGDGTISAVASIIIHTKKRLGVLPLGTLNHFAKDLRVPLDLEGATLNLIEGETHAVDVGEVNGRIFLNNSSLGLYPMIVRHREKQQERLGRGKWLSLLWATLTALRRYPFLNVRLSTDEDHLVTRTPFVFVGNNEYEMENFNIGARTCLDKGQLSLYVAHRTSRLGLLRFALRALFGGLRNEKDFNALCSTEVWIETRRKRLRVATDGEVTIMRTPLHYRVHPAALRVIVPKTE